MISLLYLSTSDVKQGAGSKSKSESSSSPLDSLISIVDILSAIVLCLAFIDARFVNVVRRDR